jgi:hypothetical protein
MGLAVSAQPVVVDTSNSTPSLERLFSFADPTGRFYIPFAHTKRYAVMQGDASRSIIQTNIVRWGTSGSVVTCDPTGFLNILPRADSKVTVAPGRTYPLGLGYGESGFALEEGSRVSVPLTSFAVWYGRQTPVPEDEDPAHHLIRLLSTDLHLAADERDLVFVQDDLGVELGPAPLADTQLYRLCTRYIEAGPPLSNDVIQETYGAYVRRVRTMASQLDLPAWLRANPEQEMKSLLESGARAILLYGPPRTGKTRFIDNYVPRNAPERATVQIHDGWTYDHLIEGFVPNDDGEWHWRAGSLKAAISEGKRFIVLEEINRTQFTQALGEVFSLIERDYRGEQNAITLRGGERFWIPEDVVIVMTMNTVDKSTEEVDDALLGRVAAVEFPPRTSALIEMLEVNDVPDAVRTNVVRLYATILEIYPLGQGYFADLKGTLTPSDILVHYKTRIRPVLINFLGELRASELAPVDNLLDELYGQP